MFDVTRDMLLSWSHPPVVRMQGLLEYWLQSSHRSSQVSVTTLASILLLEKVSWGAGGSIYAFNPLFC